MKRILFVVPWLIGVSMLLFSSESAFAVPSFSRQTGLTCSACHTSYPGLTEFGRQFKLKGYTLTTLAQIKSTASKTMPGMSINKIPNLSIILQTDETYMQKVLQKGQNRVSVNFPEEFGIYYAGRIAPHLGTFLQVTYDSSGTIGMDMSDVRYARTSGKNVWGIDFNNGPTFEDLWNSTPGYGWPYVDNVTGVGPLMPFIASDAVMTNVLGLGAYDYWNNTLYGYMGVYQSAKQGDTPATGDAIKGAAPYWRFAYTPIENFEIGTFGFYANNHPGSLSTGTNQHILDIGLDSQYQIYQGDSVYTFHARYVRERRSNIQGISSPLRMDFINMDANWYYQDRYGLGAGLALVRGDRSNFYNSIDSGDAGGFKLNSTPDTDNLILQADYLPYENLRLTLQYSAYLKFNGFKKNYNGDGRNASDNNSVILNAMMGF